eukprot:TRINITY_DN1460_c0_g1_i1.p1 TRINITY_DN1460_c0_g1~~TRINITY_DN1460_c0_g1_i1.p1  ORF type:complete len:890 (+),score=280.85 TRINITY_DN1460_c0_g1_i1:39-2708(+)
MTDAKYFTTTKKGEIHELQEELNNQKEDKRKDAVKKVIAAMTVGKDVSMLFTDVLNCIQTNNLELKKLVYLYVINHAKMQPERAILAVNTFQRDASDPNPLIRALAIRTMGCIRVDKVTEYLCEPLRNCLKDKDPYVRKTAALCVAKLYDMSPELVESQGLLDVLTQLLSDSNPTVVANAVAALTEIDEVSKKSVFQITSANLTKLQHALNECTEWGQVFILNSLAKYKPEDSRDAENICERVAPRLNHANSAVVLAAVKVMMVCMEYIKTPEIIKATCKKMAPPLVTLLTTKEPEIQYVALRNINLIVQKRPNILAHEMKVFFIKYNDPIYVKMEKLEIMIMLASERNFEQILNEFKEAASEVDVEFVRKAVRAIGRCAIKIEKAAERCIQVLLDLIQTRVNYVVQEAIVVIKDIFRKYPNRYESIIAKLCENLDTLDEPEAKASMIWIIGEYAERIENANELLESFLESFHDENTQVQLQLLTAVVKLFLKRPKDTQDMVQKVLNLATQETDNPDLRDRGYVYWRLLSTDPEAAKSVVLGEKPLISDSTTKLDDALLEELIANISTLASVYHKPPETFVTKLKEVQKEKKQKKEKRYEESLLPQEETGGDRGYPQPQRGGSIFDMDGLGQALPNQSSAPKSGNALMDDFFGTSSAPAASRPPVTRELVLPAARGNGLEIAGTVVRRDQQSFLDFTFANQSGAPMSEFAIQFNKNSFALAPAQPQLQVLMPQQVAEVLLPLTSHPAMVPPPGTPVSNLVQICIKNNTGKYYFQMTVPLNSIFTEGGNLSRDDYLGLWKSIPDEHFRELPSYGDADTAMRKLQATNVFYIARRSAQQQDFLYFSAKLPNEVLVLLEICIHPTGWRLCTRTKQADVVPLFEQTIVQILSS